MLPAQSLLEPVDDPSGVELRPRFVEALEHDPEKLADFSDKIMRPDKEKRSAIESTRSNRVLEQVRAVIVRCDKAGIPGDTLIAARMTGLMPRLVQACGSNGVAAMLNQLAFRL